MVSSGNLGWSGQSARPCYVILRLHCFVGQTLLAYSASLHIEVFLMSIGGLSWKPMKMCDGNQQWTDFRGVGSYSSFSLAYGGISYLIFC